MLRSRAGLCVGVALSALLAATPASAAETVLRAATINAATTRSFTDLMVPWKRAIEEKSGGKIEVKLGGLGEYGKPGELLGLVESGKIEIAATAPGYHPDRFPRVSVFDLPLLFETAEQGAYATWKLYEEGLLAPDFKGFKLLCFYPVTPYGVFTNTPVAKLRDLRGLRVRASSLMAGQSLNRLAIISLGLTPDAMGPSLTQGLIDGISYSYDAASTTPGDGGKMLLDQLKYLVDTRLAGGSIFFLMRQDKYDELPADVRAVLDETGGFELSVQAGRLRDQWEKEAKARLEQQGGHVFVQLTPEERAEMTRRVQPVIEDWLANAQAQGIDGQKLLDRAREIIKQHPAS